MPPGNNPGGEISPTRDPAKEGKTVAKENRFKSRFLPGPGMSSVRGKVGKIGFPNCSWGVVRPVCTAEREGGGHEGCPGLSSWWSKLAVQGAAVMGRGGEGGRLQK